MRPLNQLVCTSYVRVAQSLGKLGKPVQKLLEWPSPQLGMEVTYGLGCLIPSQQGPGRGQMPSLGSRMAQQPCFTYTVCLLVGGKADGDLEEIKGPPWHCMKLLNWWAKVQTLKTHRALGGRPSPASLPAVTVLTLPIGLLAPVGDRS